MGHNGVVTSPQLQREGSLLTIVPVWVASAIAALLIGVFSPQDKYLSWLPIALAACVFLTFCIQLGTRQKDGFVNRVMASIGGALLVLAIATAVLGTLSVVNG